MYLNFIFTIDSRTVGINAKVEVDNFKQIEHWAESH